MALTVVQDAAPTSAPNTRTLSWALTGVAVGDVVVVAAETEDTSCTLGVPSGTGLTFTQWAAPTAANRTRPYIWAAVASSSGSITVTSTVSASCIHNGVAYLCPTADGYSLAATPNTVSIASGGTTGTGTLTSTSGSLFIFSVADWNGVATTPTYASSATQDLKQQSSTNSSQYNGHGTCSASSTTVGLTAPTTGCQYSIAAIEVLKSAGGSFSGSASETVTSSISAAGGTLGSAPVTVTSAITAAGATGTAQGASLSQTVGITTAGGTAGSAAVSAAVGITAAGTVTTGFSGSATETVTSAITAAGGTSGSTSTTTTVGITAAGGTSGTAAVNVSVGITAAGSVTTGFAGTATETVTSAITTAGVVGTSTGASPAVSVGISATGSVASSQGSSVATSATIVATGSLVSAKYRLVFPTHEEPMRTQIRPAHYEHLTHALSVVKIGGQWRSTRLTALDPSVLSTLTNGVDMFVGGYDYVIDQATSDSLIAAGYTTTPIP